MAIPYVDSIPYVSVEYTIYGNTYSAEIAI